MDGYEGLGGEDGRIGLEADRAVAASPSSPAVSPLRASIPCAHSVLISPEEYAQRRAAELSSAMRSREVFGSWAAYAQSLLHGLVTFERDEGCQWGSLHHQLAYAAAGLQDELDAQAIEAGTSETRKRGPSGCAPNPLGHP